VKRVGSWRCVLHCICCGDALKTNITTLGPLVLPFSEQVMFFVTLVRKKILKAKVNADKHSSASTIVDPFIFA
jgi:hypothetical protein